MGDQGAASGGRITVAELRPLELFAGLPDPDLQWFCEHGARIALAAGERMFSEGQPADYMFVVLSGVIERFERIGGQWLKVAITPRGQVTGMLPYSRMTHYPGHTVAAEPSVVLRVRKADFPSLLERSEAMGQRLVAVMSDRVRGDVRLEQQSERMSALGRLSAGLAHELNNPAAAARRAAKVLAERHERIPGLLAALARLRLDDRGLEAVERLYRRAGTAGGNLTALERSDREEELADWLEAAGLDDAWEVAGELSDSALTIEELDALGGALPAAGLPAVIAWVAERVAADRILEEISHATTRISDLVGSIKAYSHMDRSAEHKPVDVRTGLDHTLTMLGHKLKANVIGLERDYQEDLPAVPGNAGELNQVWTNLIDNAIDAMRDGGTLRLSAALHRDNVEVAIVDSGPGIPEEIQAHVFEPFFTTKDVGEGSGLGLDIARRIVRAHQGEIEFDSRPGCTEMRVLLPQAPRDSFEPRPD